MKLTFILLIFGLMQVSAASFGQMITLKVKKVPLERVFVEIRKQTGYDVLLITTKIKDKDLVSFDLKNVPLEAAMKTILDGNNLTYTLENKILVIKEKETSLMDEVKEKMGDFFRQDSILYRGKIYDEKGKPLPGANIYLKGATKASVSASNGDFQRYGTPKSIMVVKYIGYQTQEISLVGKNPAYQIIVTMVPGDNDLGQVDIVSTGYQDIPKERATGSFEVITAKQLQHSNDPNLLKRLVGITTALSVPAQNSISSNQSLGLRNQSSLAGLSSTVTIRGQNTLVAAISAEAGSGNQSGLPLLVIDGIASDGTYDLNQINPDNIESVTILKDAAAASIWGSRAANGVIVIKTKRGGYGRPVTVSINSNLNITEKPDLFYRTKMSVSDYIDAQVFFFNKLGTGAYSANPTVTSAQGITVQRSPVGEIMNDWKNLHILTEDEAKAKIDAFRAYDVRNDLTKYLLREGVSQNYSLNISGGSKIMSYNVFGGYNTSQGNTRNNSNDRFNLGYNMLVKPFKNLELRGDISYNQIHRNYQGLNTLLSTSYLAFPIYMRLADDNGNPLAVPKQYRDKFKNLLKTTYGDKILDMTYKPLEDMNEGYTKDKIQGFNLNLNAVYSFSQSISASLIYAYNRTLNNTETYYSKDSYYMRELINKFTDRTSFGRTIPLGGYLERKSTPSTTNTIRGQLNYNRTWNTKHTIDAIAGMDISEGLTDAPASQIFYGYNPDNLSFNNSLNFSTVLNWLYGINGTTKGSIPKGDSSNWSKYKNRTLSSFANVAYTYDNRYTLSGSIRKDGSSSFGAGTNRTGTPFWSIGARWSINNENFYKIDWLSQLAFRATFGYNGNANPMVLSRSTILLNPQDNTTGYEWAYVSPSNITNSEYRPEKTGVLNIGLDFGIKGGRLNGSFEYYIKNTKDLITSNALDPSTGFSSGSFNTGDLHGYGIDMTLNSQNIKVGKFTWNSTLLLSYNRTKITKLYAAGTKSAWQFIDSDGSSGYSEGYDINRVFAYRWAGLDPQTGNPRLYLNGQPLVIDNTQQGVDAFNVIQNGPMSNAKYMGSASPVYFGSLRNTFSYGALSISANILYRFKYFARRSRIDLATSSDLYDPISGVNKILGAEYANRWQKQGDETFTNVPSMTYPGSIYKDAAYQFADINVYKADHIRLQEINLSYGLNTSKSWMIKNVRVYANLPVNVIIWRANKFGIDPDAVDVPQPRTYGFGLSASF